MNTKNEWPPALRFVWLTGGIVAINEPESDLVKLNIGLKGRTLEILRIPTYPALYTALGRQGFKIIGTTFVTGADQLDEFRAPEFRAAGLNGRWSLWDTKQLWRQIVSEAAKKNEMRLMDTASRIAAGLQFSELRLYDLAMSYSRQLKAHLKDSEPKERQAFVDTFSPGVYKDIHALFWEMAVLRDVLAEFVAIFCLRRDGITTVSGLRRSLAKSESTDAEANEFMRISEKSNSGWLAVFGAYRDCFTHSAPLHQVEGVAWAVQDLLTLNNGSLVPQVYYALPQDAEELSRRRTKGPLFDSLEEMALSAARNRDRSKEPDALEYLHLCLCQFTDLSQRLIARSPIPPLPIFITAEDIIGDIKITRT